MNKKQFTEFLQNMGCALNCATDNESICELIDLCEKLGAPFLPKWQEYVDAKKDISKSAIARMKELASSSL